MTRNRDWGKECGVTCKKEQTYPGVPRLKGKGPAPPWNQSTLLSFVPLAIDSWLPASFIT